MLAHFGYIIGEGLTVFSDGVVWAFLLFCVWYEARVIMKEGR